MDKFLVGTASFLPKAGPFFAHKGQLTWPTKSSPACGREYDSQGAARDAFTKGQPYRAAVGR